MTHRSAHGASSPPGILGIPGIPGTPGILRFLAIPSILALAACGGPDAPAEHPVAEVADAGTEPTADAATTPAVAIDPNANNDSFSYLEEVSSDKALAFARAHNDKSEKELTADPGFKALEARLFSIYSSKERIPQPRIVPGGVRNFWTDADHPRGLWRQTTLAEYKKPNPDWKILLDIGALGKAESESWVFHGSDCLPPLRKRCLISLSRGGGDAEVVREFDVDKKAFVAEGFSLKEGKSSVGWKDENTLFVGSDFGGDSLTRAGYPRIAKEWKRGTPISAAKTVFEGLVTDSGAGCGRDFSHGHKLDICSRQIDNEHNELSIWKNGAFVKIDKPADADATIWNDEILIRLRSPWTLAAPATPASLAATPAAAMPPTTYAKGTLLAENLDAFLKGDRVFQVLFEPTAHSSLDTFVGTKNRLYVNALKDVRNSVTMFTRNPTTRAPRVGPALCSTRKPVSSESIRTKRTRATTCGSGSRTSRCLRPSRSTARRLANSRSSNNRLHFSMRARWSRSNISRPPRTERKFPTWKWRARTAMAQSLLC